MTASFKPLKLALVDDHRLFRKGLISLIKMAANDSVVILFEADNGRDLKEKIDEQNLPDIILMDINMPEMNGFDSVIWLNCTYPKISILVVSMIEKEESIVRMLKLGVKGYISKDVEPNDLRDALYSIRDKGYYYTDFITGKLVHSLQNQSTDSPLNQLNERELEFIKLACSEFTYNEIASKMFLSPKTIDGYRGALFDKLSVKTRVGLALFAVKHQLIAL